MVKGIGDMKFQLPYAIRHHGTFQPVGVAEFRLQVLVVWGVRVVHAISGRGD